MSPQHAKAKVLAEILAKNIVKYEAEHGHIPVPSSADAVVTEEE
jgi:hypothetical protein